MEKIAEPVKPKPVLDPKPPITAHVRAGGASGGGSVLPPLPASGPIPVPVLLPPPPIFPSNDLHCERGKSDCNDHNPMNEACDDGECLGGVAVVCPSEIITPALRILVKRELAVFFHPLPMV